MKANGEFPQNTQMLQISSLCSNFHNFSQLICCVVVYWGVLVQQHGGLLCKQTAKSYCKGKTSIIKLFRPNPH